jgi:sugar phosphate isomerase/epimerase
MQIGVCGWCIDRDDPGRSIEIASTVLGLPIVQIGFFSQHALQAADGNRLRQRARDARAHVIAAFAGFEDEDYSSLERITATGGLLPEATYRKRLQIVRGVADLALTLGCEVVGIHHGTVPQQAASPQYLELVERCREVADVLAEKGLRLVLESGREPADRLAAFLDAVDRDNLGACFDPGNHVIYGTDDPTEAVRDLRGRVALVHVKDAVPATQPGVMLGRKAPLGAGHVEVARVVSKLRASGYDGPLLLEVDAKDSGLDAIREAADYLRSMLA